MSKLRCVICSSKSISSSKSIETFRKKKLSKLIKVFGGVRIAKSKKKPFICKDCFHTAKSAYEFYVKCQDQTVKKRFYRFSKEKINSKTRNFSSQTESHRFILILDHIPGKLFPPDIPKKDPKDFSKDRLKSIFCEFGIISEVYLSEFTYGREGFARITFLNEQATSSTWKAIKDKVKEVYGDIVTATLINENDSPIDILPDECLLRIFSFLDIFDGKRDIEDVCQRWQKLVPITWANLKTLYDCDYEDESIEKWEEIVTQSKKSLREIHINVSENAERQLKAVEKNCDNLEKLAIKYFEGSSKEFERYLKALFAAKKKLQNLLLEDIYSRCNFGFLNNLPENMVEIHLFARHRNFTRTNSKMDISKFQNLLVLQLYSFEFSNEESLSGLENLVNLEYLTLVDSIVHNSNFEKMQNFRKLKHLKIPSQTVNDDILSTIIRNNQNLEYLDISHNPNILNNTLQTIGELPKLDSLIMKHLHDLDGSPLSKMHKLSCLDCRGCSSITDWELMTLIDRATALERINVIDCNVTMRLLVSANETFKKREIINEKLLILVSDQNMIISWSEITSRSDKIHVSKGSKYIDEDDFQWDDWTIGNEN